MTFTKEINFKVGKSYNGHYIERRTKSSIWVNGKRHVIKTMIEEGVKTELTSIHNSELSISADSADL